MNEDALIEALMKADADGDTEGAQVLADELRTLRAGTSTPSASASPQSSVVQQFNDLPMWQKPLVALDDTIRLGADGATFGYGDKFSAKMNTLFGGDYDAALAEERRLTAEARERAGSAGIAAEVGGGALSMAATGVPPATRLLPRSAPWLGRTAMAVPVGAAEGAAYGSLSAMGHDTSLLEGAASGALVGSVAAPLVDTASGLAAAGMRRINGTNRTPSVPELQAAKNAAYQSVEDAGAMYPQTRLMQMVQGLDSEFLSSPHSGPRAATAPKALDQADVLRDTATSSNRGTSLYDLDQIRQQNASDVIPSGGAETRYGNRIQQHIDDMIADTSGVTTARGTPEEAVQGLMEARLANQRYRKTEDVNNAMIKADRAADSSATGATAGNQMRQKFRSILDSDTKSRGFNDEEIGLMEQLVRGSTAGNAARSLADRTNGFFARGVAAGAGGTIAGSVSGLNPQFTAAGGVAGLAALEGVSAAARRFSEGSTRRMGEDLAHLTATGRRLERGKQGSPISALQEDRLYRALLSLGINPGGE